MRKKIINNLLVTFLVTIFLSGCAIAQDKVIDKSELPTEIRQYVAKHFPKNKIIQAVEDKELLSKTYELVLSENIKLEFNKKNKIIDIDSKSKLPNAVIPKKIRQYVSLNYPNNSIVSWELERKTQKVELDNELELEFNLKGDFLKIDD